MSPILFGFKGSGKTFLGKQLSHALNLPFLDTDEMIVQKTGKNISDTYQYWGEQKFRSEEKKIIHALRPRTPTVIALGGGAVIDPENVAHLQKIGKLIYLKARFETIQQRLQIIPSFIGAQHSLDAIYKKRVALYELIPAISVETDYLSSDQWIQKMREYGF